MERKGKILECKFIKEWTGEKGTVFYHDLKLDNGDHGQIGTKDRLPDRIAVGQELTYTIEETSYGNKIKAVSQSGGGGFKGKPQRDPKEQMISFSTSYVKDLICAGKIDIKDLEPSVKRMYNIMKSLYES